MKVRSNQNKTVVIGLSGGVDSAVAAFILQKQGYKVIGAFMKNFSDTKNPLTGECNWVEEKKMAQKVASHLGIPLVTFDFEKEYKSLVIEPMIKNYKKGLTPNPDIACNTIIKFPLFWKAANKLGADLIAMGHYARIKKTTKGYNLLMGKDKSKDQSYFLSELSQEDLSHTLFPIGELTKEKVRKIAKKNRFPNWDKRSTRGICFVGKVNIKSFLEKTVKNKRGKVVDPEGKKIGTHPGNTYYTIGQRVGPHLGIDIIKPKGKEQERWYVSKKLNGNILVIAPEDHPSLANKKMSLRSLHLINPQEKIPSNLKARIRHLGKLYSGKLALKSGFYQFTLSRPITAIAPGQSIVIYSKDKLIGSGEIKSAE